MNLRDFNYCSPFLINIKTNKTTSASSSKVLPSVNYFITGINEDINLTYKEPNNDVPDEFIVNKINVEKIYNKDINKNYYQFSANLTTTIPLYNLLPTITKNKLYLKNICYYISLIETLPDGSIFSVKGKKLLINYITELFDNATSDDEIKAIYTTPISLVQDGTSVALNNGLYSLNSNNIDTLFDDYENDTDEYKYTYFEDKFDYYFNLKDYVDSDELNKCYTVSCLKKYVDNYNMMSDSLVSFTETVKDLYTLYNYPITNLTDVLNDPIEGKVLKNLAKKFIDRSSSFYNNSFQVAINKYKDEGSIISKDIIITMKNIMDTSSFSSDYCNNYAWERTMNNEILELLIDLLENYLHDLKTTDTGKFYYCDFFNKSDIASNDVIPDENDYKYPHPLILAKAAILDSSSSVDRVLGYVDMDVIDFNEKENYLVFKGTIETLESFDNSGNLEITYGIHPAVAVVAESSDSKVSPFINDDYLYKKSKNTYSLQVNEDANTWSIEKTISESNIHITMGMFIHYSFPEKTIQDSISVIIKQDREKRIPVNSEYVPFLSGLTGEKKNSSLPEPVEDMWNTYYLTNVYTTSDEVVLFKNLNYLMHSNVKMYNPYNTENGNNNNVFWIENIEINSGTNIETAITFYNYLKKKGKFDNLESVSSEDIKKILSDENLKTEVDRLKEKIDSRDDINEILQNIWLADQNFVIIDSVPVVGSNFFNKNIEYKSYMENSLYNYLSIIKNYIKIVENNFDIDLKFFNCYGPAKLLNTQKKDSKLGSNSKYIIKNTNIALNFTLKIERGSSIDDNVLKQFISNYINECNTISGTEFYIYKLIPACQAAFSNILYMQFDGMTELVKDGETITDYQFIEYQDDGLSTNKQDIIPEYLTVDRITNKNNTTLLIPNINLNYI